MVLWPRHSPEWAVGGTKRATRGHVGWQMLQLSPGPGPAQWGPGRAAESSAASELCCQGCQARLDKRGFLNILQKQHTQGLAQTLF